MGLERVRPARGYWQGALLVLGLFMVGAAPAWSAGTSATFKDRVIADWFDAKAIGKYRFGIEVEVHAPSLTRKELGYALAKIYDGQYDPSRNAVINSRVGTLEFRDEDCGHEFVTEPLSFEQVEAFARGLDDLGKVEGVEGTNNANKVGTHINLGIPEGPKAAPFVANLSLSFHNGYSDIMADEQVWWGRRHYAGDIGDLTAAFLRSLPKGPASPALEDILRIYKMLEANDDGLRYRAVNLAPKRGRRVEFRYGETRLGTKERPTLGSEHLMREVAFLGGLALSAEKGILRKDGKLAERPSGRARDNAGPRDKWSRGKVKYQPGFGLVFQVGWGWMRKIDLGTHTLSKQVFRKPQRIDGTRFIGAEMLGGFNETGEAGSHVLLEPTGGPDVVVRRSRGKFSLSEYGFGIIADDGDRTHLLDRYSGNLLVEDFTGFSPLEHGIVAAQGKASSIFFDPKQLNQIVASSDERVSGFARSPSKIVKNNKAPYLMRPISRR